MRLTICWKAGRRRYVNEATEALHSQANEPPNSEFAKWHQFVYIEYIGRR